MSITPQVIKDWLINQDSYEYRPQPDTIKVVKDPKVSGTWAVQFTDQDPEYGVQQLLFVTGGEEGTDAEILERTLEDVEYDRWPPTVGGLRFFT